MIAYSRDPYRSGTQKFLNIRLYAQGLGIMALFGTIGLASIISQRHEAKTTLEEKQAAERIQDASKAQDMLLPSKKKN